MHKSKTCPICRLLTNDSSTYLTRIHLQFIGSMDGSIDSSLMDMISKIDIAEKDEEITRLRTDLNNAEQTIENIQARFASFKQHFEASILYRPHLPKAVDSASPPKEAPKIPKPRSRDSKTTVAKDPKTTVAKDPKTTVAKDPKTTVAKDPTVVPPGRSTAPGDLAARYHRKPLTFHLTFFLIFDYLQT